MGKWETVRLSDIATLLNGRAYKQNELLKMGKYPVLRVGNFFSNRDWYYSDLELDSDKYCENGDLLFAWSASFGPKIWKGEKVIYHYHIWKILTTERICKEFLYYYLDNVAERVKAEGHGIAMIHTTKREMEERLIPLPPLETQKQIAATLDKVTALIDMHKRQLELLEELVKGRFVEMFGDPATNPKGWTTTPLLDMGYCKNGMNFHTGDSGIEMHCLGVGDFKDLSVIDGTESLPVISLNEAPPEERMLRDGDIVFVRSNGNKALVGRCLVVYPHNTPTTYSGFCIRYRLTSSEVNTTYLLRVLKADSMRKKMSGRGANIQNLNQQILATLDIPLPPIEQQQQFAAFVTQTDKSKSSIQQSLAKLETLKKSLMQEYFG